MSPWIKLLKFIIPQLKHLQFSVLMRCLRVKLLDPHKLKLKMTSTTSSFKICNRITHLSNLMSDSNSSETGRWLPQRSLKWANTRTSSEAWTHLTKFPLKSVKTLRTQVPLSITFTQELCQTISILLRLTLNSLSRSKTSLKRRKTKNWLRTSQTMRICWSNSFSSIKRIHRAW